MDSKMSCPHLSQKRPASRHFFDGTKQVRFLIVLNRFDGTKQESISNESKSQEDPIPAITGAESTIENRLDPEPGCRVLPRKSVSVEASYTRAESSENQPSDWMAGSCCGST